MPEAQPFVRPLRFGASTIGSVKRSWLLVGLASFTLTFASPPRETAVERTVRKAAEALEDGYLADAQRHVQSALRHAPEDPGVQEMACRVDFTGASWAELGATTTAEDVRVAFRRSAETCRHAAAIVTDPRDRRRILRYTARSVVMGELDGETLNAYEAWAEAAPDDAFAQGGLAAALDRAGRISDAQEVLDRAAGHSRSLGHRSRFEYVCRRGAADTKERLLPMARELLETETDPQGRAMIEVLVDFLGEAGTSLEMRFLDLIERGVLDRDNARTLWACISETGEPAGVLGTERSGFFLIPGVQKDIPGTFSEPRPVKKPSPVFPATMINRRAEGRAMVLAVIREDGTTRPVWVAKASSTAFAEAAEEAIGRWTFEPARIDGKAVPVIYRVHVSYRFRR